jgi:pyruvate ferredoxin oxidoreductase delta subunit
MKIDNPAPWGRPQPITETVRSNSDWRFDRPSWEAPKCIRCGFCYLVCPDSAIAQTSDGDYDANLDYCKGCGLCVQQCPTGCITLAAAGNRPPWMAKA